jgi:hypothetical protein
MAANTLSEIRVRGLGRQNLKELAQRAKQLGTTPQGYIKQLVKDDLAISIEARTRSFAEIMGSTNAVDEDEVDRLVDQAKTRYFQKTSKKRA